MLIIQATCKFVAEDVLKFVFNFQRKLSLVIMPKLIISVKKKQKKKTYFRMLSADFLSDAFRVKILLHTSNSI